MTFYDPQGRVTFATRELPSGAWKVHRTDWLGHVQDAHNVISMGVSSDGLLHISYDHHAVPLNYRRSTRPLDPTSFGELQPMTGQREHRVTYPQFVNLRDGTLLFFYRDGVSGRGDLLINIYHPETQTWAPLRHPLIIGAGRFSPYWCRPTIGADGSLQLAWSWRSSGDASKNSKVCYARSRDGGKTWENSRSEPYTLPITPERAEVVDPVGEGNNLSNQDSSEVDSHNRIHIVIRKNDQQRIPQYFHIWWAAQGWRQSQITRFTEAFEVKGGGTLRSPLSRANLFLGADDTLHVLYRDNRQGSRPMVAQAAGPDYAVWRHFALADVNLLQWEPTFDVDRWKQERILDLFIQPNDQGDHETTTNAPPSMVSILEWRPE